MDLDKFVANMEKLAGGPAGLRNLVDNATTERMGLLRQLIDPKRDINAECEYPEILGVDDFRTLFYRDSIAARVVSVLPLQMWQATPQVYEDEDPDTVTAFEERWDAITKDLRGESWYEEEEGNPIWEVLQRADVMCGLGSFGVILLGIDDGKELREPVDGIDEKGRMVGSSTTERNLLYLRVFDESMVQISSYVTDKKNPRYGLPQEYIVTLNDPRNIPVNGIGLETNQEHVHWSRIVHLADNLTSSELFGIPRMQQCYNNCWNLFKLYGGSAEGYWRGAFPGISLETHPQLGGEVEIDKVATREMLEKYFHRLSRSLVLSGMTAKSLTPQVADATPAIDSQIQAICILIGIPKRIFMGSERGELASSEDQGDWNGKLAHRMKSYGTPKIIVPFINRLIAMRVLPVPENGYRVKWPDLEALSELEKAQVAATMTTAIATYVEKNCEVLVPPMDYMTTFLGLSDEVAATILENAEKAIEEEDRLTPDPQEAQQQQMDMQQQQMEQQGELDSAKLDIAAKTAGAKAKMPFGKKGGPVGNEEPTDNNCGTGAGGFKPGNSCGKGGGTGGGAAGGATLADGRTKADVAKESAVRVDKVIQRYSEEHNEPILANDLGGKSLPDNEPVDVVVSVDGRVHGIELKTMVVSENRKITMKRTAMERKRKWERKNKGIAHTVVFDDSAVFNAKGDGQHDPSQRRIFYRRGYGSFRVDTMHEVTSIEELKQLISSKRNQLPEAAGGKKGK